MESLIIPCYSENYTGKNSPSGRLPKHDYKAHFLTLKGFCYGYTVQRKEKNLLSSYGPYDLSDDGGQP
jgi:hypothetical protein